jgi:hypothetical protein
VFHFHDTSRNAPVKQQGYLADNRSLHPDARNLAAVVLRLRDSDQSRYQRIVRTIKQVAPFFRDFVLEAELAPDRVRLRWQQEGSDTVLPADALSDGRCGSSAWQHCWASRNFLASSSWTSRNWACTRSRLCSWPECYGRPLRRARSCLPRSLSRS